MTARCATPRIVWIAALLLSFGIAGLVVVAFLLIGPAPSTAFIVPPLLAAMTAFGFCMKWPDGSWRWGLLLSSGFCVYFLVVFLAYLSVKQWDGLAIARACSVALAGLVGSAVATRIRRNRDPIRPPD